MRRAAGTDRAKMAMLLMPSVSLPDRGRSRGRARRPFVGRRPDGHSTSENGNNDDNARADRLLLLQHDAARPCCTPSAYRDSPAGSLKPTWQRYFQSTATSSTSTPVSFSLSKVLLRRHTKVEGPQMQENRDFRQSHNRLFQSRRNAKGDRLHGRRSLSSFSF